MNIGSTGPELNSMMNAGNPREFPQQLGSLQCSTHHEDCNLLVNGNFLDPKKCMLVHLSTTCLAIFRRDIP